MFLEVELVALLHFHKEVGIWGPRWALWALGALCIYERMNAEDQHEEEYKQQALLFKDQGNEAFQAGNVDLAIQYFTQAISIDPDNHIVYSNRSAAYMKINHISKALHDAEICVELAPNWSKGYNRLGTAQQGLKRFDAAIQSFKKGIELDPNNPALWSCLKLCEKAYEKDKEERFKKAELERQLEEERLKRREDAKNQILKNSKKDEEENLLDNFFDDIGTSSKPSENKHHEPIHDAKADEEDNLLASFFSDVTNANSTSKEGPNKKPESDAIEPFDKNEGEEEEKTILTEKYVKQPLGSSQEVVDRLLCPFHEWKNLNPYHVFSLDIDATDEDIKFRYKKLSLKVHPDRCRGIENAREAFELVKAAYEKLMDEDQRKTVIAHIENVTNEVNKGRKKLIKEKGVSHMFLFLYPSPRILLYIDNRRRFTGLRTRKTKEDYETLCR